MTELPEPRIQPLADAGILATFGSAIDVALSQRISQLVARLETMALPGITDLIPSYTTLTILLDPRHADPVAIAQAVRDAWRMTSAVTAATAEPREVVIPVVYGGEHGPDLADVAAHTGLSVDEIVRRHAAGSYIVGALGFAPGFAFLIGLPPELATPRRSTPRTRVPEGSVGIGGAQTGVYAQPTPGGWSLIGRTPLRLFRPEQEAPLLYTAGDTLRFQQITDGQYAEILATQAPPSVNETIANSTFTVLTPGLQTTIQDLGRPGHGRVGVTPGGAVDRRSHIVANRLVGNADDAATLELTLIGPRLRVERSARIAIAGADLGATLNGEHLRIDRVVTVHPGDELAFNPARGSSRGARAYLAVAGGFDSPIVMGSRATDLTAAIGGIAGRALQAGDQLAVGEPAANVVSDDTRVRTDLRLDRDEQIVRVVRGPQDDRFDEPAWNAFLHETFTVSSKSNRMGVRLDGPAVLPTGSADVISEGMVTGGIQITTDGQPIVMLAGRATIGGYAKIATVITADHDRLAQMRPGTRLRFAEVTADEAFRLASEADTMPLTGTITLPDALRIAETLAAEPVSLVEIDLPEAGFHLRIRR